ncbi:hypothetical protein K2D_07500 [Planctomycetes bacterium K2D]|uniref:Uncharacterized protein n=1 Tax=Botrimarina mediterranea TaxID=2528022 RepID=A0A518K479_9BACT|nr:hypothetical protein Spa11_07690 [Botrimarina mediterranea]QDV77162.1 hypothetical protein K2D_07500 [Planctomycetes bacterium K2D]
MDRMKQIDGLQFHDNKTTNQEIKPRIADRHSLVSKSNGMLSGEFDSSRG